MAHGWGMVLSAEKSRCGVARGARSIAAGLLIAGLCVGCEAPASSAEAVAEAGDSVSGQDAKAPRKQNRPEPDRILRLQTPEGSRRLEAYYSPDRTRGFLVLGRGERGWASHPYRLWKTVVADIDGDGTDEVIAGMWSSRRRHDEPQPHRTVWVLDLRDQRLVERWRGSALARPLIDYTVQQASGPDELVAFERAASRCYRTRYTWTGFGFAAEETELRSCDEQVFQRK